MPTNYEELAKGHQAMRPDGYVTPPDYVAPVPERDTLARAAEGAEAVLRAALAKGSPDQPRDDHGRWSVGGGGSSPVDHGSAHSEAKISEIWGSSGKMALGDRVSLGNAKDASGTIHSFNAPGLRNEHDTLTTVNVKLDSGETVQQHPMNLKVRKT